MCQIKRRSVAHKQLNYVDLGQDYGLCLVGKQRAWILIIKCDFACVSSEARVSGAVEEEVWAPAPSSGCVV